jgi:UDP-glucose 4-epimerase
VSAERARFSGTRCVVTGGLGFIGSNVALALAESGAEVTAVDALVEGHGGDRANLDGSLVRVVYADVGDAAAVSPVVAGADHVFDLAGQVSHLASARDPERDFALNAIARLRFLEILRKVNPGVPAVFASTRQVYGRPASLPVGEDHAPRPTDVNGVAKLAAEHLHLLRGEASVVLRLSNVYGPRQHLRSDDLGVLPVFVRRALRGETLVVYGGGEDTRDALHVDDVVEAILAAALTPGAAGRVLNIGHREHLTLWRLAELTAAASPARSAVVAGDWPPEHAKLDVGSVYVSSALAEASLGWQQRIAFAEGIAATLEWFSRHPERYD